MSSSYDRSRSPLVRRSNNDYNNSSRGNYDRRDNDRHYDDYDRSNRGGRDRRDDRDYDSRRRNADYDRYDRSDRTRQDDKYISRNDRQKQQAIPDEDIKMESSSQQTPEPAKKRVPISIEELIQKKEQEKLETAKVKYLQYT